MYTVSWKTDPQAVKSEFISRGYTVVKKLYLNYFFFWSKGRSNSFFVLLLRALVFYFVQRKEQKYKKFGEDFLPQKTNRNFK